MTLLFVSLKVSYNGNEELYTKLFNKIELQTVEITMLKTVET